MPEMSAKRRRGNLTTRGGRFTPTVAHEYGPPIPPNPWPKVTVGHPSGRHGEYEVNVHPAVVQQRRQISALAYLGEDWPRILGVASEPAEGTCCLQPQPSCGTCPVCMAARS